MAQSMEKQIVSRVVLYLCVIDYVHICNSVPLGGQIKTSGVHLCLLPCLRQGLFLFPVVSASQAGSRF